MCSNSLSVRTLTDWLTIRSRDKLALWAASSLPCGSHCLQCSTRDLQGKGDRIRSKLLSTLKHNKWIMCVPERRATVDQSYGPGHVSFPSVSKFSLSVMKHLHLPLKTGHAKVSWESHLELDILHIVQNNIHQVFNDTCGWRSELSFSLVIVWFGTFSPTFLASPVEKVS